MTGYRFKLERAKDVPFAKDVIENQRATNILLECIDLADLYHGAK